MVFISSNGGSVRSISVSRGSGPAVTSVESKGRGEYAKSGYKLKDRLLEGKSRLYTRIDAADPAVILLFLFGLVLLIGLSVSLCYPVQHTAPESKPQVCTWRREVDFVYLQLACHFSVSCFSLNHLFIFHKCMSCGSVADWLWSQTCNRQYSYSMI